MEKPNFRYGRREGFHIALSLLSKIQSPFLLEVGVMRAKNQEETNGFSTKIFAHYINHSGGTFVGVDISYDSVKFCLTELEDNNLKKDNVKVICADAIDLMLFPDLQVRHNCELSTIDLLYVDGWDYSGDRKMQAISEKGTLKFIKSALQYTKEGSLILFDDVYDDDWNGKAKRAIPYLLSNGWLIVFRRNNQALLIKDIFE